MTRTRIRMAAAILALAAALGLAACGGGSHADASQSGSATPTASASASSSASSTATPAVDRSGDANFPDVTGAFGKAPKISKGSGTKPARVAVKTLSRGSGAEVGDGDVIVANYALQLWGGKSVDSSFTRGQAAVLDMTQLVSGWRYGVAGAHVGDRLELVIPPEYAYGSQSSDSVPANSTLVFVVDVIDTADPTDTAALRRAKATGKALPAGLTVRGSLGKQPTIAFAKGAKEPTTSEAVLLSQGKGQAVKDSGYVVCQIVAAYWGDASTAQSTWGQTVQVLPSSQKGLASARVGSRVVLLFPKSTESASSSASPSATPTTTPATVLVVDIVGALRAS